MKRPPLIHRALVLAMSACKCWLLAPIDTFQVLGARDTSCGEGACFCVRRLDFTT